MEDKLVLPETAIIADKLGFKGETMYWYQPRYDGEFRTYRFGDDRLLDSCREPDDILAPTQSLLAKWLREVHNIHVEIESHLNNDIWYYNTTLNYRMGYYQSSLDGDIVYDTFELAMEAGLQEALKLIKI